MKITVSEEAIRQFLRETISVGGMGWQTTGDVGNVTPIDPNDVVDPSAAVTDPNNANFRPTSRSELKTAVSSMIDDMSNDRVADAYEDIQDAISTYNDEDSTDEEEMKNDKKVEEAIRKTVRKMLSEAGPYRDTGMSYSGPMIGSSVRAGYEECEACEGEGILDDGTDCSACKGTGAIKSTSRKNKMMTDVGGSSFKDIATEMGYASESGAKQAVEKALEKARFVGTMDPTELEIITLSAMNDYVETLRKSGELSAADVQLMKDHPAIVSELDGFREFLDKALKKTQRSGQQVINPVA